MKGLLVGCVMLAGGLGLASHYMPRAISAVESLPVPDLVNYDRLLFPERAPVRHPLPDGARVWHDDQGRICEATLVGVYDGMVRLRRVDGRFGEWPVHRLSLADRRFLADQ